MEQYIVRPMIHPIEKEVTVPGSKSMTNRALFMAAMASGKSVLKGVLLSDDSRVFLGSLSSLGFEVIIDEEGKSVTLTGEGGRIPINNATIYVGSAGTAARFLTALLALSDGEATINCSEQMKARPMKPLFDALSALGATFTYLEQEGFLPVHVKGRAKSCMANEVSLDISKSTQFLSALLMSAPLLKNGLKICITSEKKQGSYINITRKMMENFGVHSAFDGENYTVAGTEQYLSGEYNIEPDVSAACYFYALAALTGSSIIVRGVHFDSMQGDVKFLEVLKKIGCTVSDTPEGIKVIGKSDLAYEAVDINMNDFSDQTMTLAAMAPFMCGTTVIRNVGHIRLQESNRMQAIINELNKAGIECREEGDDLIIKSGKVRSTNIATYEDHRMAMAFSLLGLRTEGIVILDPMCCSKTFKEYFEVLDSLYE